MRAFFSIGAALAFAGSIAAPALARPWFPVISVPGERMVGPAEPGQPRMTARAVSGGAVRSNTLLPLGGSEIINNHVPQDLQGLSGWSDDELRSQLQKEYPVDVVAVSRFLNSPEGEAFLLEGIGGTSYVPYSSQSNGIQAVRAAIVADASDGQLSGYGMMAALPTDQRLQGAMQNCVNTLEGEQATSLLSWYATTPACVHQRTLQAQASSDGASMATPTGAVRGLW